MRFLYRLFILLPLLFSLEISHAFERAHDSQDTLILESNSDNGATSHIYDSQGRLIQESFNDCLIISYTYDSQGILIQETHSDDTASYTYDSKGRLILESRLIQETHSDDMVSYTASYTYDSQSRLLTKLSANDCVTTFTYDSPVMAIQKPYSVLTATYTYDSKGRLIQGTHSTDAAFYTYEYQDRFFVEFTGDGDIVAHYEYIFQDGITVARNCKEQPVANNQSKHSSNISLETIVPLVHVNSTTSTKNRSSFSNSKGISTSKNSPLEEPNKNGLCKFEKLKRDSNLVEPIS